MCHGPWQVKQIQAPKAANGRDAAPRGPSLSARLAAWLEENKVRERLGGDLQALKWLSRCLLTIGGRSIGHLYSYLDRHEPLMNDLLTATGDQVSCTRTHARTHAHAPTHTSTRACTHTHTHFHSHSHQANRGPGCTHPSPHPIKHCRHLRSIAWAKSCLA